MPSTPGGGNERTSFLLSAVTLGGKIVSELSTALYAVVRLHLTVGVSERSLKVNGCGHPWRQRSEERRRLGPPVAAPGRPAPVKWQGTGSGRGHADRFTVSECVNTVPRLTTGALVISRETCCGGLKNVLQIEFPLRNGMCVFLTELSDGVPSIKRYYWSQFLVLVIIALIKALLLIHSILYQNK